MSNRYTPLSTKTTWVHQKTPLSPDNFNRLENELYAISRFLTDAQESGMILGKGTILGDTSNTLDTDTYFKIARNSEDSIANFSERYISLFSNIVNKPLFLLDSEKSTVSIGKENIAGVTGYYWDKNNVTFFTDGSVLIPLIKDKHPDTVIGNENNIAVTEIDWLPGDSITLEMVGQYPYCSTLLDIKDVLITFTNGFESSTIRTKAVLLDTVPFEKIDIAIKEVYDDYSIFAIKRVYDGVNSITIPRTGTVQLGYNAQIFGTYNFGGGINAASFGSQNLSLGDNGFVCGRDNINGNAAFTAGHNNTNLGFGTTLIGESNLIKAKRYTKLIDGKIQTYFTDTAGAFGSGSFNTISVWNGTAFGRHNNVIHDSSELVMGQFNKEVANRPLLLVGNGGWSASGSGNTEGVKYEIIDGGTNAPICRDNAFAVYYNGSAEIGSRHTLSDYTGIFTAGTHNTITTKNSSAFGSDNYVATEGGMAIGKGLDVHGDGPCVVIGQYNKKNVWSIFTVACGNSDTDRNNDIFRILGGSWGSRIDATSIRAQSFYITSNFDTPNGSRVFSVDESGNLTITGKLTIGGKTIDASLLEKIAAL